MAATALIIAIFFVIIIATISFEAVFRNESKENFDNGIKGDEEEKHPEEDVAFPTREIEKPKKKD